MPHSLLEAALTVARERHAHLLAEDVDGYAARSDDLRVACDELVSASTQTLTREDLPGLDELIALETASRRILQSLMDDASDRLEALRAHERASGAYARSERFSVNGA